MGREHPFTYTFSFLIRIDASPSALPMAAQKVESLYDHLTKEEKKQSLDFSGSTGVKTLCFHCRSAGLIPGPGSSTCHLMWQKKKKKLDLLIGQSGVWVQAEKEPQLHYSPTLG